MPMTPEEIRVELRRQLEAKEVDLAEASKALGRNHAYLHQFITRGKPRYLHEQDRRALADIYHINIDGLLPPTVGSVQRKIASAITPRPGDPINDLREAAVVGAWRRLPQNEQDILFGVIDAWGRRNVRTPIAV